MNVGPGLCAVVLVANPFGLGSIDRGDRRGGLYLSLAPLSLCFLAGQYQFIKISVCFVIYERWLVGSRSARIAGGLMGDSGVESTIYSLTFHLGDNVYPLCRQAVY